MIIKTKKKEENKIFESPDDVILDSLDKMLGKDLLSADLNGLSDPYLLIPSGQEGVVDLPKKKNRTKRIDYNNIIAVTFISTDQKINKYPIFCVKTDRFAEIEENMKMQLKI